MTSASRKGPKGKGHPGFATQEERQANAKAFDDYAAQVTTHMWHTVVNEIVTKGILEGDIAFVAPDKVQLTTQGIAVEEKKRATKH